MNSKILGAANNKYLRGLILPTLKIINKDINIRHHWTNKLFRLNLFRHKGYWFYGKEREKKEMIAINRLVTPGGIVAEVGGHIGYLSLWFLECLKTTTEQKEGVLFVFEPGNNNLPYLRKNLSGSMAQIVECGCGDFDGESVFNMDNLTGQNNSFVNEFEGLKNNKKMAPGVVLKITKENVKVVRLDSFFNAVTPNFIKIDTEGFEFEVLKGAEELLNGSRGKKPIVMVEVQSKELEIFHYFKDKGYKLFNSDKVEISKEVEMKLNLFALHPDFHQKEMLNWLSN